MIQRKVMIASKIKRQCKVHNLRFFKAGLHESRLLSLDIVLTALFLSLKILVNVSLWTALIPPPPYRHTTRPLRWKIVSRLLFNTSPSLPDECSIWTVPRVHKCVYFIVWFRSLILSINIAFDCLLATTKVQNSKNRKIKIKFI